MTANRSVVLGCGSYLPERILTNAELATKLDTSDEWIIQRTGIRQRHIAAEGEFTSHLAIKAAQAALAAAGVEAQSIDLIVLATSTPDNTFPATAVVVQNALGINHGAAFDLQAVCSGFVFALATVDNFLRGGAFKRALVIGAETFSRILDWNDRSTCVLFGDGAGAIVLDAQPQSGIKPDRGVLTTHLRSDGRHKSKLYVDGGVSSTQTVGHLRMEGKEVFKHAVGMITDVIVDAFKASGITADDIDWFIPHQANKRIIDASAHKLHIAPQKVVLTVDLHGNTSAASIPLALAVAVADGRVKKGDLVLLEAMGGGFTWGSALLRW
ncbi:beta-ketoacyl-ACP synthase III [uncultured Bradyrhizobium sp.]|uniref:beta-ketoacyl-ACP synthase III n=1 Tax=uncultured Bradyrhizobium sp. TaxID=199684 RepID=UPI0035CBEA12